MPLTSKITESRIGLDSVTCPHPELDGKRASVDKDELMERWIVRTYAHASRLLAAHKLCGKDWELSEVGTFGRNITARRGKFGMVDADGNAHSRLRRPAARALALAKSQITRETLKSMAKKLVARLVCHQEFDLVEVMARPYAASVLATTLGLEGEEEECFLRWTNEWMHACDSYDPEASRSQLSAGMKTNELLLDFFTSLVSSRTKNIANDFVSHLVQSNESDSRLTIEEIAVICLQVVLGGGVTVTEAIGNGVVALLENPEQLALLRAQPELMGGAVDEMLRFAPPAAQIHRFCSEQVSIDQCEIQKGETLSFDLRSCNRDPTVFMDPNTFDIRREGPANLSFGGGPHRCFGAALAKMELECFFSVFVEGFPAIQLKNAEHKNSTLFNGYRNIILTVG